VLQAAASPAPYATPIDQTPLEALAAHGWSDAPVGLLGLAAGLQIAAVLIGAAISVRRSVKP